MSVSVLHTSAVRLSSMKLPDVIRAVSPAVVAFGSRIARSQNPEAPGFPPIIGTGFFVDKRGPVMTTGHPGVRACTESSRGNGAPGNANMLGSIPP